MTTPAAIETTNLTRDFESVRAVDELSIRVETGTVFGFLGPNGSGKTTTIRLLLGLIPPSSGDATVLGFTPWTQGDQVRARTGALLEHTGLYERMTAVENLEFFARIWRMDKPLRTKRIQDLLEHFGLWDRRDDRIGEWSRGMRQKLAIARALIHQPPLIFLDEPTAGLDPVASASLRNDLSNLATTDGVTVFLTTHNLTEAERLCDHVAVIYNGHFLGGGPTKDLIESGTSRTLTVRVDSPATQTESALANTAGIASHSRDGQTLQIELCPGTDASAVVRSLVERNVDIVEVTTSRSTLEDAFLDLVNASNVD